MSILLVAMLFSCTNSSVDNKTTEPILEEVELSYIDILLNDFDKFKTVPADQPIQAFQDEADLGASMVIKLTHENMEFTIEKARQYAHCVITCGNHTIAVLDDLDDCQESNAWKTCMPSANAYIKKGDMTKTHDYLNNIIGIQDDELRIVYFFE